ncbi:MAG: 16S rRNA (adenine(1518)-N(6)/adenine(1519)-N(6))-dimethyltransferase RsmA [Patescibacteria group bacterium]
MIAKKSLGQHFLKSEKALNSIVRAGDIKNTDTVLEIGPGQGALTKKLLATSCQVIAIEKDDGLVEELKEKFEIEMKNGKLELIHGDILKFETSKLEAHSYKLIANIPYNITGAIFKKFLSIEHQPERIVLLVQKEVAERIVAKKSKPFDSAQGKESILSISIKVYGKPIFIEKVLAGSFAPAPTVDSAILLIENISKDFFEKLPEEDFFKLLKAGFASKRKKLSSNLSNLFPKNKVFETFKSLGLNPNIRAEDTPLDIWSKIASKLV